MPYTTLISAEDIAPHLGDPDWRIFDCRCSASDPSVGRNLYRNGHIPGARHADLDRVLAATPGPQTGRHPLPDRETLAAWLGQEGVNHKAQVVAYDDAGGAFAARLWWLMRWLGHDAVAVLDGGLAAWQAAGGELETGIAARPCASRFTPGVPRAASVNSNEVTAIVRGRCPGRLIDARGEIRYLGEEEPINPVAGHIPGAVNIPFADNLDPAGHFLSREKLRERFRSRVESPTEVIHYCGSGVTACHNLLAMEHAGFTGSRLYPGSWSEWIRDPDHPVRRGPESG